MNHLLQIFDDLEENRSKTDSVLDQSGIVGKRITAGWVEFGAIDHTIIEKLQNEEEPRARLQGAEELHRFDLSTKCRDSFTIFGEGTSPNIVETFSKFG